MRSLGVTLPFIYTPHPVVSMPPETLYGYLEGDDPLTGRRVIDEIVDCAHQDAQLRPRPAPSPLPSEGAGDRETLVGPDTEDNLQRLFYERGWTDGLPVILPTEERVENMLTGTGRPRDELVGEIFLHDTKEMLTYTVFDIAVVAVMAGARPEHLPVILAVAATKQSSLTPSTTPFGSMLLVNGPIRNEISMNSGLGGLQSRQPGQRGHRQGLDPDVHMLGLRPAQGDPVELPGQRLSLQQHVFRRERRAERLGAVPRAEGLPA